MEDKKSLTTEEALKYLGMSRGTFFSRLKERGIKPSNHNPALKKQHRPEYSIEDLDTIKVPTEEGTLQNKAA